MDLAVRTAASPAAIWTICVVAVACLAFWLIMVMVVATRPDPRLRRVAAIPGSVVGEINLAAGGAGVPAAGWPRVPVQREPQAPAEPIPAQRTTADGAAPADAAGSGTAGPS